MTQCPTFTSHTQPTVLITKNNLNDLIPDTYDRTVGTKVTVRCVDGLRLVGTSTFNCLSNGQWSYSSKPYCTDQPEVAETDDGGLDDTAKIVIGVVCGIAALIVIALICMICVIMYRDRRRRRERRYFWEGIRKNNQGPEYRREHLIGIWRDDQRKDRFRGHDGPSTIDMAMYGRMPRVLPPPPYEYRSHESRDYESRGSRLSNPMYLPGYERPGYRNSPEYTRKYRRSRSYDDLSETGKKPYVRDWVSRSSRHGPEDHAYSQPSVHGSRYGRDPYLWREANY